MSDNVSITVQFKPFVLELIRSNDRRWVAELRQLNDPVGTPPLVLAHSDPGQPETEARIRLDDATPMLRVGAAAFSVPKRQLLRLSEWIAKQHGPVDVVAESGSAT